MPLVTITCQSDWYPADNPIADDPLQRSMMDFATELPGLFSNHAAHLRMKHCPSDGVQVNFEKFHPRAINAPKGVWVKVEMAEVLYVERLRADGSSIRVRDEEGETEVKAKLKELLQPLLGKLAGQPQVAVDVFWGPDHGWLVFGDVEIDW